MKKILLSVSVIFFVLILFSCSDEERTTKVKGSAVRLKAFFETAPQTRIGNEWSGTEHAGLYMVESDQFTPVGGVENKEYTVSAGTGSLLIPMPEEGEAFYPENGKSVRFIAYYPYRANLTNAIYPIDLTDTGVADHDLLYAKTDQSYNKDQAEAVSLTFVHQLAKLILKMHVEKEQQTEQVSEWTASVHRNSHAEFDLATGTLSEGTEPAVVELPVTEGIGEIILLPGSHGKIVIVYEGKEYEWNTEGLEFKSGTQYTYKITLKPTEPGVIDPVQIQLVSSIQDWNKENGEVTLPETEEEKQPTENPDEETGNGANPLYESNIDLSTVTAVSSSSVSNKDTVEIEGKKYPALKLGSTGNIGKTSQIKLDAGTTKLKFYAFTWGELKKSKLKVSISKGAMLENAPSKTIEIAGSPALKNNSPYKFESPLGEPYELSLTGVTNETTITFETLEVEKLDKRAVLFGLKVE